MGIKETIIQEINVHAYRAARDEDKKNYGEIPKDQYGPKEKEFLKRFKDHGFRLYQGITGLNDNDKKEVYDEMKKTLNEIGLITVKPKTSGESTISVSPLLAMLYDIKPGDRVRLTLDNKATIERDVEISTPRNYSFGELVSIGIYDFDIKKIVCSDDVPTENYLFDCKLEIVRRSQEGLRHRSEMDNIK